MRKTGAATLMVVYLGVFFWLTLVGFYQQAPEPNFEPFRTILDNCSTGGPKFVINILGNLVAGFPMGILLPVLLGRRCSWAKVAGAGLAVSLLIEWLQWISGHRCADVDDVILNTTGSLLGYGFWLVTGWLGKLRPRAYDPYRY